MESLRDAAGVRQVLRRVPGAGEGWFRGGKCLRGARLKDEIDGINRVLLVSFLSSSFSSQGNSELISVPHVEKAFLACSHLSFLVAA